MITVGKEWEVISEWKGAVLVTSVTVVPNMRGMNRVFELHKAYTAVD